MAVKKGYYLGFDQGSTKSYAAVCSKDGEVIGCKLDAPSPFYMDDPENKAMQIVRYMSDYILNEKGLPVDSIIAACGGMTGLDWEFEYPIFENRMREGLKIDDILAVNDCVIAMRGGSNAPNRAVICAGTGLNISVQREDNKSYTFGYYIGGNINGAAHLGGAAVSAAVEAEAGIRPPTAITDFLLQHTGYDSMHDLYIDMTMRKKAVENREFVLKLLETAIAGDNAAIEIIDEFALNVSKYVDAALKKMELQDSPVDLVFSGSVFKNAGSIITKRIKCILFEKFPSLRFVNARYEPVCGALLLLLDKKYNGNIPDEVISNFDRSCQAVNLIRDV